jgi:glycosyltransferase involved in cell wall biosynthesis
MMQALRLAPDENLSTCVHYHGARFMTRLSVVLISKNQAWNIRRLVESVLRGTAHVPGCEVLLVDSASEDETITLASGYPIEIVQLCPDQQLTAAAGRYVGYKRTAGELVLFLDGDMELCGGWLTRAMDLLDRTPQIAVITGMVVDVPPESVSEVHFPVPAADGQRDIRFCGGAGMFRRAVLQQVGTYNPYLYSDEEPELCLRIRRAGYRVVQMGYPIAKHYSPYENALRTLLARWRRNLYLGGGQIIRYHLGTPMMLAYLQERGFALLSGTALLMGAACLATLVLGGNARWFASWCLLVWAFFAGNALRKHSLRRSVATVLKQGLILIGTLKGLLLTPLAPESYPEKLRVVNTPAIRTPAKGVSS